MLQLRLALVMTALAACGPKQTDEHGSESETASTTTGTGEPSPVTGDTGKTTGSGEPSCPDANSFMSNGECFCNVGYEWCSPEVVSDLSCCEIDTGMTAAGTTSAGSTSAGSTSGDATTGGEACGTPPPARCDPNSDTRRCDSGPGCELGESTLYSCKDGLWQPDPAAADAQCVTQGHDFAYGCVDDGGVTEVACGDGPGTACADDPGFCTSATVLQSCLHGKLADTDCLAACKAGEIDGIKYETGFCLQSRISPKCMCCNPGDPGCP